MRHFLRETWELWYWAMFCPSKPPQQMKKFLQFLLLLLGFSLPLTLAIAIKGQGLDWLLLPVVLLTAFLIGLFFLPAALVIPLIWGLVYIEKSEAWLERLNQAFKLLPPLPQLGIGLAAGTFIVVVTLPQIQAYLMSTFIVWLVLAVVVGVVAVVVGVVAAVVAGVAVVVVIVVAATTITVFEGLEFRCWETVVVAVFVAGAITVVVAVFVAVVAGVTGVATLPLPLFSLVCWLIAFSFAPAKNLSLGIWTAGILAALAFEHLGWRSLLAVPIALVGYYRIFPDFLILAVTSFWQSILLIRYFEPLQLLHQLPPHTTELLWLPLPNHDRILAAAFRTHTSAALATFQQMQASPLPGFKRTIRQALPQIVADQLAAVSTIPELLATATPEHPVLPFLVSAFYRSKPDIENPSLETPFPFVEAEISLVLPKLQEVVMDVRAALAAGNAALRERGLERIRNNLSPLQAQLPGLGLKAPAIKRWQPVLERWQRVIELELEEQQKQSQGELLNPFQYGNPLRRDRPQLFKGRKAFADNIVRLVLDANRPTLVLHGPRRCGKSSFLLNLPQLLPRDLLPIYLDMQSAAVTTDEAAFCQGLVRAISKDSRSPNVELPAIPQRKQFLDTPYIALEDWLEQAVPKLGDRRLLLNLDEFEKIGSAINEGRMSLRLFDQLRHLIQHYDQLGFLFSGVQTLDELGPNWSSYFISVVPIEMLYLEPSEAEDLLVKPDPKFRLDYDTGIVEEILTLTRCHPYLLQLIGWSLVKLANENHTQLVTSDLLQTAIPEAFTNGQPYFTNIWTEFTGTSPAEVAAGQELLLALAQGHQLTPVAGDETAQAARRRLLRYHVIEHINGSDRFEVPLIERWVQERAVRN
jgi:hypothetical protein